MPQSASGASDNGCSQILQAHTSGQTACLNGIPLLATPYKPEIFSLGDHVSSQQSDGSGVTSTVGGTTHRFDRPRLSAHGMIAGTEHDCGQCKLTTDV